MTNNLQIDMEMPRLPRRAAKKKKRQRAASFQVQWVKLPRRWFKALQQSKKISTYRLALVILFEEFKREQIGGKIVLSMEVTGMPRSTRMKAVKELEKLGLIKVNRHGRQAIRVA